MNILTKSVFTPLRPVARHVWGFSFAPLRSGAAVGAPCGFWCMAACCRTLCVCTVSKRRGLQYTSKRTAHVEYTCRRTTHRAWSAHSPQRCHTDGHNINPRSQTLRGCSAAPHGYADFIQLTLRIAMLTTQKRESPRSGMESSLSLREDEKQALVGIQLSVVHLAYPAQLGEMLRPLLAKQMCL